MKILYIHQYFKTRDGAGSTRSYEFARYLISQGHEVTFITSDIYLNSLKPFKTSKFISEYRVDDMMIYGIRSNYSNYMGNIRRIISFLSFMLHSSIKGLSISKEYDVVFATSTPLTIGIPAVLIRKLRKVPFVFEVRDLWPEAPIQMGAIRNPIVKKILQSLEKLIYNQAMHIVALSPGMEKGVLDVGIASNKVSMIPNCSDLGLFDIEKNHDTSIIREKYGLGNKLVVTHGGSMGSANGLDYIIRAAILLNNNNYNNIMFMLTGDGQTRPILEKMCADNNLTNVVFTGSISKNDMPSILHASDITITSFKNIPILSTNSPNKFFDSLAASKPVIVNSNGWTKDIVEKHDIGFYVDPEKPEDLYELLIEISNKKSMLEKMGIKARKLAEKEYDRLSLAKKIENLLLEV